MPFFVSASVFPSKGMGMLSVLKWGTGWPQQGAIKLRLCNWLSISRNGRVPGRQPVFTFGIRYHSSTSGNAFCAVDSVTAVRSEGAQSSTETILRGMSNVMIQMKQTTENVWPSAASRSRRLNESFPMNFEAAFGIAAAVLFLTIFSFLAKPRKSSSGSVADLVKRGQLRADRKSDSRPLMFEDPFNNPMVKMRGKNPVVQMCGKIFRLQPVTLTQEKMLRHQNRRVQAYQWKRPTVFLIEGEPIPENADPDTVRWIPSNHPFATAKNEIDEVSAELNVYQTRGVPSRVRVEHETLLKKTISPQREIDTCLPTRCGGIGEQSNRMQKKSALSQELPNHGLGRVPGSVSSFDSSDVDVTQLLDTNFSDQESSMP